MSIASFDIDGVIFNGHGVPGIYPGTHDIIITGRSFEEEPETVQMLQDRGIRNKVYFNELPFAKKSRESSGYHKAEILNTLNDLGMDIVVHYEDDPVQADIIESLTDVYVIRVINPAVPKENRRQDELITK